jgi:signal transduction histidine kinase
MARSLRSRVWLGAILWTIGLVVLIQFAAMMAVHRLHVSPSSLHWTFITLAAAAFLVAGITQLRGSISPFQHLRARLAEVREGRASRLEGGYPAEVQPLVDDLNALLDHREQAVRRALARAGDLAHGLKTPLAVLAHDADRAGAAGGLDTAAAIEQQVARMRRQVDYHLAQARAAASGAAPGARAAVLPAAEGLARAVRRLHAERGVAIELDVPAAHAIRGQLEDLEEMLGNLLDNACTFARSRVVVRSAADRGRVTITVDDDGPGLDPALRETVLQRGVRADEAASGTGLGLAIVRDLAALYGGSIALDASPLGGLRATLVLPAA